MPVTTTNLGLTKPDVGVTGWGGEINTNFDTIDSLFPGGKLPITKFSGSGASLGAAPSFNGTNVVWQTKPVFDVRDYASVNAAADAAMATGHGGVVLLPPGVTTFSSPIVLSGRNVGFKAHSSVSANPSGTPTYGSVLKWTGSTGTSVVPLTFKGVYDPIFDGITLDLNGAGYMEVTADVSSGPTTGGIWDFVVTNGTNTSYAVHVGSNTMQVSDMWMRVMLVRNTVNVLSNDGFQTVGMEYELSGSFYLASGGANVHFLDGASTSTVPVCRIGPDALYGNFYGMYAEGSGKLVQVDDDVTQYAARIFNFFGARVLYGGADNGDLIRITAAGVYNFFGAQFNTLDVGNNCKVTVGPAASSGAIYLNEYACSYLSSPSAVTRNFDSTVKYTRTLGYGDTSALVGSKGGSSYGSLGLLVDGGDASLVNAAIQARDTNGTLTSIWGWYGRGWGLLPYNFNGTQPFTQLFDSDGSGCFTGKLGCVGTGNAGTTLPGTNGDICASRASSQGVLYFGTDGSRQLFGHSAILEVLGMGLIIDTATPSSASGQLGIGTTTSSTVGAAGGASALPATPTGYLVISLSGTSYKIPYFAS